MVLKWMLCVPYFMEYAVNAKKHKSRNTIESWEGEANHHCTGEACPVCANIHQAEQTLRNLSTGTIVHAAVNPILIMCVLVVVTTIFPEYDWVKEIAGDKASNMDPTMLLDNGVDLHSYQPPSDDILKISDCALFVYVGGESDGWGDDALKNATNKDIQENFAVASLKNRKGIISGIRSWI